jgi:hypothetical protein
VLDDDIKTFEKFFHQKLIYYFSKKKVGGLSLASTSASFGISSVAGSWAMSQSGSEGALRFCWCRFVGIDPVEPKPTPRQQQ